MPRPIQTNFNFPRSYSNVTATIPGLVSSPLKPGASVPPLSTVQTATGSSGGLTGFLGEFCFGFQGANISSIYTFDADTNFECEDPVSVLFRTEDLPEARQSTFIGVLITYRDLGPVTITVTLKGQTMTNTSGQIALSNKTTPKKPALGQSVLEYILSAPLKQIYVPVTISDVLLAVQINRIGLVGNLDIIRVKPVMQINTTQML